MRNSGLFCSFERIGQTYTSTNGPERCPTCILCGIPLTGTIRWSQADNSPASCRQDAARRRRRRGAESRQSLAASDCGLNPVCLQGQLKSEEPLPSYVSLFSERVPNTTNHVFGSRLSTPLGSELVRLDRLLLWSGSHHKRKQDPEVLPC
ncbi:hypothetical protein F2P81_003827 [Scophthalmus maximus]|uniref:Uncharacterized protein n=1 Tax=Scophthalmus maximus TaxID=52904 RepID=A0A6A4TII8_SCOMX|nr:hypothetical protein F2P81_003827 [Scophthalmus maximus]